jgi:hypothetical protein
MEIRDLSNFVKNKSNQIGNKHLQASFLQVSFKN